MAARVVRAVTFDYWNTIVRADADQASHRRRAWQAEYASAGHAVDDEVLHAAFRSVWSRHHEAWLRNQQLTGEQAADQAVDLIGLPVDEPTRRRLVERFLTVGEEAGFRLCEGVADVLADLHARGVRLGIVCDVGFTPSPGLLRILGRFDLLGYFRGWSFSDDVGWYKPAPEIFRHALEYLAVPAEQVAHVGDLRRTDVAGARAMGMTAVRYRGANDDAGDGPEADHIVDHHAALPSALAL